MRLSGVRPLPHASRDDCSGYRWPGSPPYSCTTRVDADQAESLAASLDDFSQRTKAATNFLVPEVTMIRIPFANATLAFRLKVFAGYIFFCVSIRES